MSFGLIVVSACSGAGSAASGSPSATTVTTAAPSASRSPIPLPNSAQVAAAGNGVVWVSIAERLFRSTDRGQTWSERAAPPGANVELAFVNDVAGFALVAGPPATQCQSQSAVVVRTMDGGATWGPVPGAIGDARCKTRVAFVDAYRGYVGAYDTAHAPVIWRTTDGGGTWKASAPLPDPPGFTTSTAGTSLRPGAVADFGATLLVSATGQAGGAQQKRYVFRSTDGGATWSFATNAPDAQNTIVFLTPLHWLQIAPANASQETTDGGLSWHAFATDYTQAAPVAPQIVFGDPKTGYATVRGGLSRTTDGGAHWTTLRTPGT